MKFYTGQPQRPPPVWETPTPQLTAGQFGPATIGHVLRDEAPKLASRTANTLRPSDPIHKQSEYVTGPSGYYVGPSTTEFAEQNTNYYQQTSYPPQHSISLPQNHGIIQTTHGYEPFRPQKARKI
jgi:hypothetical protein